MAGPQYTSLLPAREPIVETPRNPFVEGILNIAKVIEDNIDDPEPDIKFGRPKLRKVYRGSIFYRPEFPCCDIRFVRMEPTDHQEVGTNFPTWVWNLYYSVRYLHDIVDKQINEIDCTRNLFRLLSVIVYNNELHGFCPNNRLGIVGVSQDIAVFSEIQDTGFVLGGAIVLKIPYTFELSFFDHGFSEREFINPSGPRY